MKLLRQRKNKVVETMPDLILPMGDGTPVYQFPDTTIDNMRALINRMNRSGEFPRRLAIVSALRQEGVTYISRALATTLAHDTTQKVCIVDMNWWWPSPTEMVAVDNPGLAGVISGEATLAEVTAPSGWSNLVMVPAGNIRTAASPGNGSQQRLKRSSRRAVQPVRPPDIRHSGHSIHQRCNSPGVAGRCLLRGHSARRHHHGRYWPGPG
jgi:hypothetical protein